MATKVIWSITPLSVSLLCLNMCSVVSNISLCGTNLSDKKGIVIVPTVREGKMMAAVE